MLLEFAKVAIFVFAVSSIYAAEFVLLSFFILRRLRKLPPPRRGAVRRAAVICLHLLALAGTACILYAYNIEPRQLEVNHIDVPSARLSHASLTVVQISDLHCETTPGLEDEVVRRVNELRPDIVVFTGDAVNSEEALPRFRDTLRRINATLGKFAVRGNVDKKYSNKELFDGTGFAPLNGNYSVLQKDGNTLCVTGLSEIHTGEIARLLAKTPVASGKTFTIFLHHYPSYADEIPPGWVDLSLSGHTHGGQVALPFYGAVMTFSRTGKKYERGVYHTHGALLYVNKGVGMEGAWVPRIRFLARPEIAVFHIHPASERP